MPEFPEVHTVIETLKEFSLGKKITSVDILRVKNIEGDLSSLIGSTITSFEQVGKFIIFHFDSKKVLISHLRMEGKYFYKKIEEPFTKHEIASLSLDDCYKLVYNDVRKFGILKVSDESRYLKEEPLSKVGPNPFEMKDASRLISSFKHKSIPVKTALLDQSIMSGLGNIYVDEVLYECRIHPETPANALDKKDLEKVLKASQVILDKAIQEGGSTIKSYHPKEGVSGNFQVSLKVYGKKDGSCLRCGHHLRKIFVGGRGTTYCPNCQKNPTLPHVIAITGPIGSGKSAVLNKFKKLGYTCLDSDEIVHELYKDKSVQNGLMKIIPELHIKNGEVNRDHLRLYLLENPKKKVRLEKYVHSLVTTYIENAIKHSKNDVAMEVPLLFESHLDDLADEIIYVDAPLNQRKERVLTRDTFGKENLLINDNYNKENKKKATRVIINDKGIASLEREIEIIYGK